MSLFADLDAQGHEQLVLCADPAAAYRAVIAIHSTVLGPAVGGTRLWRYASEAAAITDALRLARGMTYKTAMAGLPLGGGKAVILAPAVIPDRPRLFHAHGRFVERFGGRFITAEDVGTSPADMALVHETTGHVKGLTGRSGDPSPVTARGVFRALLAAARHRWGTDGVAGKTVALQGCGNVGARLVEALRAAGARLVVTDVDAERVRPLVGDGVTAVAPDAIYDVPADIFAPCALGAVLNDDTIPRLRVEIVAGAANNQLDAARHGDELHRRGILYVPDYVANAGGVINGCREILGWDAARSRERVERIYDTVLDVLARSETLNVSPARAADGVAEERLRTGQTDRSR